MSRIITAAFVMVLLSCLSAYAACTTEGADRVFDDLISSEDTLESEAAQAFISSIHCFGQYYIVEGDIPLTEEQVKSLITSRRIAKSGSGRSSDGNELIVVRTSGELDFWRNRGDRHLSFAIDRHSFLDVESNSDPELVGEEEYLSLTRNACRGNISDDHEFQERLKSYLLIVKATCQAAAEWEKLCEQCGLTLSYKPELDAHPSFNNLTFVVQFAPGLVETALSFLPSFPKNRRYVYIGPSFFNGFYDFAGLMRHELGHALGYDHEQNRVSIAGCRRSESGDWHYLTPYDPHSVMHYFCPLGSGGVAGTKSLAFTGIDQKGHRRLYGEGLALIHIDENAQDDRFINPLEALKLGGIKIPLISYEIVDDVSGCDMLTKVARIFDAECHQDTLHRLGIAIPATFSKGNIITVPDITIMRRPSSNGLRGSDLVSLVVESPEQASAVRHVLMQSSITDFEFVRTLPRGDALFSHDVASADCIAARSVDYFYEDLTVHQDGADSRYIPKNDSKVQLYIVDVPVYEHPDIMDSLVAIYDPIGVKVTRPYPVSHTEGKCFEKTRDHATHMAGVIASRGLRSHYKGLTPGVKIISYNYAPYLTDESKLASHLARMHSDDSQLKIFLLATKLGAKRPDNIEAGKYPDEYLEITKAIGATNALFVVASGQKNSDPSNALMIARDGDLMIPMGLGWLPNLLVVTACIECDGMSGKLLEDAYYSQHPYLIHLAAPGYHLPGLTATGENAAVSGTSQAAAYVAGVAAMMADYFPAYYSNSPMRVKVRLIVTAKPLLDISGKLAGGVVDPSLARKDPSRTWLARHNTLKYQEHSFVGWCSNRISLASPKTKRVIESLAVLNRNILRVKRVTSSPDEYMIWKIPEDEEGRPIQGVAHTVGPGILNVPEAIDAEAPLAMLKAPNGDNIQVSLGDIDDLIIEGTRAHDSHVPCL